VTARKKEKAKNGIPPLESFCMRPGFNFPALDFRKADGVESRSVSEIDSLVG
jgi:hypothetical protein